MKKPQFKTGEDYLAVWLGGVILVTGLLVFVVGRHGKVTSAVQQVAAQMSLEAQRAPFSTVQWYELRDAKAHALRDRGPGGAWLKKVSGRPQSWSVNPIHALFRSEPEADARARARRIEMLERKSASLKAEALEAQAEAAAQGFEDEEHNAGATTAIRQWRQAEQSLQAARSARPAPHHLVGNLLLLGLLLGGLFTAGARFMGGSSLAFFKAFWGVYLLAVLSYVLAAQTDMKNIGFGYAAWAILIGLVISNTTGIPGWLKPALRTEYYIKTGLVLLGAEILFGKILTIGLPGLFVAWVVTPIVLVTTFWFGQRVLRIASKTLNITISADMSVCGVSAAIATAAACRAKKEELTLAIGLSMVFTSIMMIVLPALIRAMGIPEVLGGAWIGGTIDATGAVVAAGAFLGERALNVAATIKMIQNILIGIVAFAVAVYWAAKVEKQGGTRVGWSEIWRRFPKFILGFIGASLVFTSLYFVLGNEMGDALIEQGVIRSFSKNLRGWLFCLAFVSIGLSTNFKQLRSHFKGGKPLILYLSGQTFNLLLTLLMAYLMFYLVFPDITRQI